MNDTKNTPRYIFHMILLCRVVFVPRETMFLLQGTQSPPLPLPHSSSLHLRARSRGYAIAHLRPSWPGASAPDPTASSPARRSAARCRMRGAPGGEPGVAMESATHDTKSGRAKNERHGVCEFRNRSHPLTSAIKSNQSIYLKCYPSTATTTAAAALLLPLLLLCLCLLPSRLFRTTTRTHPARGLWRTAVRQDYGRT